MTVSQNAPSAINPSEDDIILEIEDTTVTFDMDRGKSKVLNGVTMDIQRQEILGVVGESGSGKSMFASALLNAVVEPGVLTGDITYHPSPDEDVNLLELSDDDLREFRWTEISMVFQGAMSSFNPTRTIEKHFHETLVDHDVNVEEGFRRAHQLLSDLYLDPERVLESYPHELSGGMQQRALIALALVLEPKVLVMDEPTAALDLLMQRSILSMLEEIQEKYEITMVFITHDLPLVASLADRLAVMYAFQFIEIGNESDIIDNAAHPYTRSLLKATPNLDAPLETMMPIEGSSPDPVKDHEGCLYAPRCPLAAERCKLEEPGYHEVSDTQAAKCFYWEQSADKIPFADEESGVSEP